MLSKDWEKWAENLNQRISKWLEQESVKTEDGYECKRCGQSLMNRTVYCSVHEFFTMMGSHGGGGRVHTFYIPECPNEICKNHRPSFWDGEFHLDGDTLRGPCIDS